MKLELSVKKPEIEVDTHFYIEGETSEILTVNKFIKDNINDIIYIVTNGIKDVKKHKEENRKLKEKYQRLLNEKNNLLRTGKVVISERVISNKE